MKAKRTFCIFSLWLAAAGLWAQAISKSPSEHYNERVAQFAKEKRISPADIVMLGDSHTEFGGDWNTKLKSRYRIVNRGIIGDDANDIRNRLSQVCSGSPKAVFFECGANDLSHGLTAEQVVTGVTAAIETIRRLSPKSILFVQSVFPINESFGRWKTLSGKTDTIPEINHKLKEYCKLNNIVYIDLFRLLRSPGNNSMRKEICKDGLHLLSPGYDIWAAEVQRWLNAYSLGE